VDLLTCVAQTSVLTQGLVTRRGLARNGVSESVLTRAVAAGSLVRVRRRVYAAEQLPPLPRYLVTASGVAPDYVRHTRAVLMSIGPRAFAEERTAAALHGWGMLVEPSRTVEVGVPHSWGSSRAAGARVRQRRSVAVERRIVLTGTAPVRITTPVQTVLDCAVALPLVQAVVVCDSALRAGDVTLEALERAVGRIGRAEAARGRRVLALCDPEAGSVLESVLRAHMALAGIEGWASQTVLHRDPEVRVDFCFPEVGLVVEVDGTKWHQDPVRDQTRDNGLAALGWRVLRFRWAAVVHDTQRVLDEISVAVAARTPRVPAAAAA
jgi:very-short-patch-repair endonuclease/uncharacterized protein (UPF0548 family)